MANKKEVDSIKLAKNGKIALFLAIISLFIFGFGLSIAAIVAGIFGMYHAIKNNSGTNVILWNIAAIVVGLISNVLLRLNMH